jgi:hypothetical protein
MKPVQTLSDDEFAHLVQRAVALPDAPPALVRAAIDAWPGARTATLHGVAGAALRLVAAVLRFDSWAQPAVATGMRAGASDTRHLLFSAMGRDVDLRISPVADRFALTGQILGPDASGSVELAMQGGVEAGGAGAPGIHTAALDELGEFRLDGVPGGTYQVTLRMGDDEIVLPAIVVGERPR